MSAPSDEDPDDRESRQLLELLNELRVALPGVQILFAFLLTVPFSNGWNRLTPFGRDVFYVTMVCAAMSTACLISPSASHRLRFHQRDRKWIIESSNTWMVMGLIWLAAALIGAVLLITDLLFDGVRVWIYTALVGAAIIGLWFVRPLLRGLRTR
jgi:hypothetical protein